MIVTQTCIYLEVSTQSSLNISAAIDFDGRVLICRSDISSLHLNLDVALVKSEIWQGRLPVHSIDINLHHIEVLIVPVAHSGPALRHPPQDVINFTLLFLEAAYAMQLASFGSGVHAVIDPWGGAQHPTELGASLRCVAIETLVSGIW